MPVLISRFEFPNYIYDKLKKSFTNHAYYSYCNYISLYCILIYQIIVFQAPYQQWIAVKTFIKAFLFVYHIHYLFSGHHGFDKELFILIFPSLHNEAKIIIVNQYFI